VTISKFFQSLGIKLVVIACNTATVNAPVDTLRQNFPKMTFVGVEPPVKPLEKLSKTREVAIFATPATCKSNRLKELICLYGKNLNLHVIPTPEWAPMVESGDLTSEATDQLLLKYLEILIPTNTDWIALACTHYPFLKSRLIALSKNKFQFLDIGQPVANQTLTLYKKLGLPIESGHHRFITTAAPDRLTQALKRLLSLETTVESIKI
jgi:glutamate racemase